MEYQVVIKGVIIVEKGYGYQTIGSLIQSLKDLVENNGHLTMDSPIFMSDYNMSSQKYKFSVLPSFSSLEHKAGVCLFHSLNEPVEEPYSYNTESHKNTTENKPIEDKGMTKFARWYKG